MARFLEHVTLLLAAKRQRLENGDRKIEKKYVLLGRFPGFVSRTQVSLLSSTGKYPCSNRSGHLEVQNIAGLPPQRGQALRCSYRGSP